MLRTNFTLKATLSFLSLWLSFFAAQPLLSAAEKNEKGLFYYVVDRSGSITTYGLTDPIRRAITEHVSQLPEETEVRLVFFSRQASESQRWPLMTPEAKKDFADYFAKNFISEGPTRLYDTVGEVMDEIRAASGEYRFVTLLIFSDGENNWSRSFRSWKDLEPVHGQLVNRHGQSFVYWITLEFDPAEEPPAWVQHEPQAPGTKDIPIPEPAPLADFTAHPRQLKVGEPIQFAYVPKGGRATKYEWDFGDGNGSSLENPQHRYEREGRYTVILRALGPGGKAEEVKTEYVQVSPVVPLTASFRLSPERVQVGDTVELQDFSEGNPEEREWRVNGEPLSSEERSSFTVETAAEIEFSLTVKRGEETDTASRTVQVIPLPPPAGFSMEPEEAEFDATVVLSAGEHEEGWRHRWTIDGEVTLEGATVEWPADRHGLLHIVHTVEGPGGLSQESDRVFVHPPVEIIPSTGFSVKPRVFFEGDPIAFAADETAEEWVHEWLIDGEKLGEGAAWEWPSDRIGNLVVTHRIRIPDTETVFEESEELLGRVHELVRVAFSASQTSGTFPMKVRFQDESVGEAVAYQWDFGDGNSSTERNPTHTYEQAGRYWVTLTVTNPQGEVTSNVDPTVLSVVPPMPLWQKVAIGAVIGVIAWVGFIVPAILRPMLAPEKGPKLVGIKTYSLHLPARRGWTRFFWPKSAITIGSSLHSDIRLPNGNGKRGDMALIERAPAASSYNIRPLKRHEIFKIEKETSLMNPEVEGKSKITGARLLRDGDTFEIGGERLTWRQPKKNAARRPLSKKQALTRATTYQS